MADSQLDRIERKLDALTALVRIVRTQENLMANDIIALSQQIDDATNLIASSLATSNEKLDAESTAITDLAARVQKIIDSGGVPQSVVDQLTAVRDRLGSSAATIGDVTTSITGHVTSLQGIAADPTNPVPASVR